MFLVGVSGGHNYLEEYLHSLKKNLSRTDFIKVISFGLTLDFMEAVLVTTPK